MSIWKSFSNREISDRHKDFFIWQEGSHTHSVRLHEETETRSSTRLKGGEYQRESKGKWSIKGLNELHRSFKVHGRKF